MPSLLDRTIQGDYSAGMVRNVARHLIPENGAFDIRNGLLTDDGSIYKRAGTIDFSNAAFDTELTFLWDGYFDAGQRTLFASTTNFGVLDTDDATPIDLGGDGLPYPRSVALIASMLFISGGYIYAGSRKTATYSTGTVTTTQAAYDANGNLTNETAAKTVTGSGTSWTSNVDPGMLFQVGTERCYVVSSVDSDTQITLRDVYEGTTGAGKSYTLHNIYEIQGGDPYPDADIYLASANRLIWADAEKVRFSKTTLATPPGPAAISLSEDYHELPEGVRVIGLAEASGVILVFTTAGLYTLHGIAFDIVDASGNPQHQLRRLADHRLFGQAGLAQYQNTVIAPCVDGIYMVDGISLPIQISEPVEPLYLDYTKGAFRPGGATVFRDHYLLPIHDGSAVRDMLVCRLQPARAWSRLTESGSKIVQFAVRIEDDQPEAKLLGASFTDYAQVLDCDYFSPDATRKNDADGETPRFRVTTRDYLIGAGTLAVLRFYRLMYELLDAASDDPVIYLDIGSGSANANAPEWGDPAGEWGVGFGPTGTAPWTAVTGDEEFETIKVNNVAEFAPVAEDYSRYRWRIGKRRRSARLRLRNDDPCAKLTIRAGELFIRPPGSLRR